MSKQELRNKILARRRNMSSGEVREKSLGIMGSLLGLEPYGKARTLMAYIDVRNEVLTGDLIKDALARGKKLAVPMTDSHRGVIRPSLLNAYPGTLLKGAYGIPEPGHRVPLDPGELDLVVLPGVAFDEGGFRLGYGGGYYDRFLPLTRPDTLYLALAYEFQIQPRVFHETHDCPVHIIITEERIIYAGQDWQGALPQ